MAKNVEPKKQPVVSNLPMPVSETPLVIDLPDGQKLVVGKMETGSVIEVATWRGTGRPDSRTSRLMLGMSSSQSAAPVKAEGAATHGTSTYEAQDNSSSGRGKKLNFTLPKFGSFAVKLPEINLSSLKKIDVKGIAHGLSKTRHKLVAKSKELTPVESVAELDIEQWLTGIKREAEMKASRSKARLEKASNSSSVKKAAIKKNATKKPSKKRD